MTDFSKLIFLPLDMLPPPDISDILDIYLAEGIDEYHMVTDDYRISPSIILMSPDGEWLPISKQIPEFVDWAEKELFSWTGRSQMVVITTAPGKSMATHIDCSPHMFIDTWQHKFRYVIRGNTTDLKYITKAGYVYMPDSDTPYIIKGSWPHNMHNTATQTKFTLCLGSPWEPNIGDKSYMDMLERSYKVNNNKYISYNDWKLPNNFRDFFNEEKYDKPDLNFKPNWI